MTSSPYLLRKRIHNELSDAGEDSDSDAQDTSMNKQHSAHLNSSGEYTEEHTFSFSSGQCDRSYNEYTRTSAERSVTRSPHRVGAFVPESERFNRPSTFRTQPEPIAEMNSALWKFLLAFAMATIFVYYAISGLASTHHIAPKVPISCPQFKELNKYFLHQDMLLWKSLKVGIENVLNENPAKPSVFLLAYTDIETTKNVMAKILNATANCMQTTRPIQLNGATFATAEMIEDYGEIIAKYRDKLQQEKIMYVSDVNKTPAAAAQAFHVICDTIEPLVEKAVIFFTVHLEPGSYEHDSASVLRRVEQVLETNWMSDAINENTLNALIGRVTDQVFMLRSENFGVWLTRMFSHVWSYMGSLLLLLL